LASYVGTGQGTPLQIISFTNEAFVAAGQNGSNFNWIATLAQ
jgi:hypothetical protein